MVFGSTRYHDVLGSWAIYLYDAGPVLKSTHRTAQAAVEHLTAGLNITFLPFEMDLSEAIAWFEKEQHPEPIEKIERRPRTDLCQSVFLTTTGSAPGSSVQCLLPMRYHRDRCHFWTSPNTPAMEVFYWNDNEEIPRP